MKRLSFLTRAGMPLTDSLALLAAQMRGHRLREGLARAREQVEAGQSLATSLADSVRVSAFSIAIIRIGEASGSLAENLDYLALELEKGTALRTKVLGALLYPAMIACATIALTAGLILFIFPKILPVFAGLGVALPLSTRIVLGVHTYLQQYGLITAFAVFVVVVAIGVLLRRSRATRYTYEIIVAHVPLIGSLFEAYALSTLCRTLSLLLQSGMSLPDALLGAASVLRSERYTAELIGLARDIEEGADLASRLRARHSLFPDLLAQMVQVGESSGSLIESLSYLANYYASEVEEQTKRLSGLAEPVLMIGMGCVVGFVAISMITPMYEITQHLNQR